MIHQKTRKEEHDMSNINNETSSETLSSEALDLVTGGAGAKTEIKSDIKIDSKFNLDDKLPPDLKDRLGPQLQDDTHGYVVF